MDSNSSLIDSGQQAPHKDLRMLVQKHIKYPYQNIIPDHARASFEKVHEQISQQAQPVILDSGCGTGESSYHLAQQYPQHWVIGIDKSQHRLDRSHAHGPLPDNLILIRDNLIYFWQLALAANLPVQNNYLFYPNPWPKPGQLQRRWHGHPIFPILMKLSPNICLRTNWRIYAEEFVLALELCMNKKIQVRKLTINTAITAFERKYKNSGHDLYEVNTNVGS